MATMPISSNRSIGRVAGALTKLCHCTPNIDAQFSHDWLFHSAAFTREFGYETHVQGQPKALVFSHPTLWYHFAACGEINLSSWFLGILLTAMLHCNWLHLMPYTHTLCIGSYSRSKVSIDFLIVWDYWHPPMHQKDCPHHSWCCCAQTFCCCCLFCIVLP